jgi:3-methylornithyl-N6-L-lysine dehydrogenase
VTRLSEDDVNTLVERLKVFETDLRVVCDLGLTELAVRTVSQSATRISFKGARAAAVPITTGEGVISGFSECVATILRHLGCEAWVTEQTDVRGIQEAIDGAAEAVFVADDYRFVALNVAKDRCVDDDPATADGYVTALEAAAGSLVDRKVLLLGLGPVGRAAARRLVSRGAVVLVVEPHLARMQAALDLGLALSPVVLAEGLARCDLVFDASPAAGLIDTVDLRPEAIAAVPGMPSAFTAAAQVELGPRHIHEPLAIGVAVMAARAFA